MQSISGHIVDVVSGKICKGHLQFEGSTITGILPDEHVEDQYIIPGFVDAHIHIESSMMVPSEFAKMALTHGTVACVCDPHEIANVCGVEGIDFMIENGLESPMKFYFGAPSCVPSTHFETSGAEIDALAIEKLLKRDDIYFLAEMMNFPGVIHRNKQVIAKLNAAKQNAKPVDGHAPEISGEALAHYANAGISTDHECMTIAEAEAKIALGMKIQIREGSAAKNFDALLPLVAKYPDRIMFCSDDKHPDDLLKNGHIDTLVRKAVAKGYDVMSILRICSLIPIKHYKLNVGLIQAGDEADFLVVNNLSDFAVKATYIKGVKVTENGQICYKQHEASKVINQFEALPINTDMLIVQPQSELLKVIMVDDGQLYTTKQLYKPKVANNNVISDIDNDILKIVVYNRYKPAKPAIGFIKNMGLKRGAIASTVAHDSHNIVAVGTSDEEITSAINALVSCKGGIVACDEKTTCLLPLPIAGLMSNASANEIAHQYEEVDAMAKSLGTTLTSPFMTLAFMSLLVLPELKLGDKGLFDGLKFEFTSLFE